MTTIELDAYRRACKTVIREWNAETNGDEVDLLTRLNAAVARERRRLVDLDKGKVSDPTVYA